MNYHNFYGPYQISNSSVFFKGMYRCFEMKTEADLIRNHAQMNIADLKAQLNEWEFLIETLDEMDEASYWNDKFRKDGLS
jgi:adenylate cyclase